MTGTISKIRMRSTLSFEFRPGHTEQTGQGILCIGKSMAVSPTAFAPPSSPAPAQPSPLGFCLLYGLPLSETVLRSSLPLSLSQQERCVSPGGGAILDSPPPVYAVYFLRTSPSCRLLRSLWPRWGWADPFSPVPFVNELPPGAGFIARLWW